MQLFVMIVISVIFMRHNNHLWFLCGQKSKNNLLKMLILFNRKREQNVCMCKNFMSGNL